jgi:hypothetical protein
MTSHRYRMGRDLLRCTLSPYGPSHHFGKMRNLFGYVAGARAGFDGTVVAQSENLVGEPELLTRLGRAAT